MRVSSVGCPAEGRMAPSAGRETCIFCSDGPHWRDYEDDRDKGGPDQAEEIDGQRRDAHVPWTPGEAAVEQLVADGDAVGNVVADGADGEDGGDSRVRAEANGADQHAERGTEPDSGQRCARLRPRAVPDTRQREHLVA